MALLAVWLAARRRGEAAVSHGLADCDGMGRLTASAYLNALCTVVLSFDPRPCMTAMIATEIPAATRPYSTAVAPDSSFAKRFRRFVIVASVGPHLLSARGSGSRYCPALPNTQNHSQPYVASKLISASRVQVMRLQ